MQIFVLHCIIFFCVQRAFESLSASTHLYGRRLVVEWATEEETVEDIRRRTASHFVEGFESLYSSSLNCSTIHIIIC